MSVPFLLVFALAAYEIFARRRPLLRLCREGIEIVQIGESSLDGFPLIPGLIRVAWLILSTQGFRHPAIRIPWRSVQMCGVRPPNGPPIDDPCTAVTGDRRSAFVACSRHRANQIA